VSWTETPERPGWRGVYVAATVCQQFCDNTGVSRTGNAINFAAGRTTAAEGMPAIDRMT